MNLDQFMHQRQPDPRSFLGTPLRTFHSVKTLEQTRQLFFGNSNPGIADLHLDAVLE